MIADWLRRAAPLAAFVAALAAGSASMIRLVPPDVAPFPPMPTPPPLLVRLIPPPAPRPVVVVKDADIRVLRGRLEDLLSAIQQRKAENDNTSAELDALQKKVDDLRAEVETLEARRAALLASGASVVPGGNTILEVQVADDRRTVVAKEQDLANVNAQLDAEPGTRRFSVGLMPGRKLPAPLELIGNRIAPVDRDFFHFPLIVFSANLVVTRKRPGETIAEARQPGSMFAKFLERVRREHCYVSCLLNSDSFDAFFAVRDMATRAGLEVSWEPAWTQDGDVAITRVRLTKGTSENQKTVALPEVVR